MCICVWAPKENAALPKQLSRVYVCLSTRSGSIKDGPRSFSYISPVFYSFLFIFFPSCSLYRISHSLRQPLFLSSLNVCVADMCVYTYKTPFFCATSFIATSTLYPTILFFYRTFYFFRKAYICHKKRNFLFYYQNWRLMS